jgi:hypothetical protein
MPLTSKEGKPIQRLSTVNLGPADLVLPLINKKDKYLLDSSAPFFQLATFLFTLRSLLL